MVKEISPETVVIMITAFATTETAIAAMKQGAYDYVTKPFKVDELRLVVEKALEKKLLSTENQRLRTELRSRSRSRTLVGTSRLDAVPLRSDLPGRRHEDERARSPARAGRARSSSPARSTIRAIVASSRSSP